jgi:hypothetical protein
MPYRCLYTEHIGPTSDQYDTGSTIFHVEIFGAFSFGPTTPPSNIFKYIRCNCSMPKARVLTGTAILATATASQHS